MRRVFVGGLIVLSLSFGGCFDWTHPILGRTEDERGIDIKVTVHDPSGNELREYTGIMVVDGNSERTKITMHNIRILIVDGGIVITEDMKGE